MLRLALIFALTLTCCGCQIGYFLHTAYHQSLLINGRVPIDRELRGNDISDKDKEKLKLVQKVKVFAESELGLKHSRNYTTFVKLDEPYVTYIVQAAYAHELKPYLWNFPFIGHVPYKGYFKKSMATDEAASFDKQQYDTYVRGVSAYSTLGWFQDSVLSTMLRYEDYELAEIIIHETVHTTLYVKSAAEFNERMATFLGVEGMKLFYIAQGNREVIAKADRDAEDQAQFSKFLTREIEELKRWYTEHKLDLTPELKAARLKDIQTKFTKELRPKLQAGAYHDFETKPLNNAFILAYQTYEYSLEDFRKLFAHFGGDFKATLAYLKTLERDEHPDQTLKSFVGAFKE